MKKIIIFVTLFLLFISFSILISAQELVEDRVEIETSIVLLTLYDIEKEEVYKKDDFFEIFNFTEEDYILLPANLITPYLEVELNFNREFSLLTLSKNQREIRVDLFNKKYVAHAEWDNKKPIIYGGEFYLAKEVFSYLTDYQITWDDTMQEVIVEGQFISDIDDEEITDTEEKQKLYEADDREILGLDEEAFQLSSVHYRVQLNLEDRVFGGENKDFLGDLNFYGRTGNWAYYLNNDIEYNLDHEEIDYELDNIKFKYQENNILIIAGDYDFMFEETIGSNEMQGLYFSMPDRLTYKLIPYTTVTVEAEKNDEIIVYLNGNFFKKREIKKDGRFSFENIELKAGYLNKIEIVKIKESGAEEKEVKYIAGSRDILSPGVKEIELFAGRYKDDSYSGEDWEGYFGAVRSNFSLSPDLSAHIETAVYNEEESTTSDIEGEILSSITGLSFRLSDSTVINFDWLVAGQFDNLENGAQAKLLYSMFKGYIEGIYLYIPPETAEYMQKEEGEDISLSYKLDLTKNLSINPIVGQNKTLEDRVDDTNYYYFKIIYEPSWRNYNALSLYYEENTESYFYYFDNDLNAFPFLRDKTRKGARIENNIYGQSFRISNDLSFYNNQYSSGLFPDYDNQDYGAEIYLYKRLSNNLLISLNYNGEQQRDEDGLIYYDREYDGQIRLSFSNRSSLTLETNRSEEESEDASDLLENRIDEETKLRLDHYFNREFSLTGEITDYHSEFLPDYQSISLSGNYYYPDNPGYIRLSGEYIVPDEGDPGISFSAAYDLIRDDESEIKIEIGREYSDFINEGYEDYAMISYSHAISFINGEQRKSRFTDFEPRPIVAGYAYLDENYNGIMDQGEKRLQDIPMRLGNMLAVSDEDGFYIFKPYFNDIYFLNFDYRNLIADYTPVTEEILVRVKDNQNIMQNFGLTINGTVKGNVFIDENANGAKDEGEEYLMWAGLELDDLNRKDYTDPRGEFYFQNVPLGYHQLILLVESLPKGTKPLNGYEYDIYITEDKLDYQDLDIPIVYGD